MTFYENQPCTRDQKPVYVPVKNVILMNPVTPMGRVLAARPRILFGHFCKGAKICLRTEAELLPHSQWEPLVVQHKGRYTDCHMAQSVEMRALSFQCCLAAFMGFLPTFFFNL